MPYKLIIFDWNGTLSTAEQLSSATDQVKLFSGVPEMLAKLHQAGIVLAIATMAPKVVILEQLKSHNIDQYFTAFSCGDSDFIKPHPVVIESIVTTVEVEPAETLMVGDSDSDLACARYAGVDMLKITGGMEVKPDDLAAVKGCVDVVTELPDWLSSN